MWPNQYGSLSLPILPAFSPIGDWAFVGGVGALVFQFLRDSKDLPNMIEDEHYVQAFQGLFWSDPFYAIWLCDFETTPGRKQWSKMIIFFCTKLFFQLSTDVEHCSWGLECNVVVNWKSYFSGNDQFSLGLYLLLSNRTRRILLSESFFIRPRVFLKKVAAKLN